MLFGSQMFITQVKVPFLKNCSWVIFLSFLATTMRLPSDGSLAAQQIYLKDLFFVQEPDLSGGKMSEIQNI